MISTLSVTASIYRVTQDQQTLVITFYIYNQLEKTIETETRYSTEGLYEILFDEATQYQNNQGGGVINE